jgi:hypothetical protein
MGKVVDIYCKKVFSLSLIFNSLLTVVFAMGLLASYYTLFPDWTPYAPFIVDGRLFWLLIPAALFNIFPCVNIGKVHTGRLWFHHYVYGLLVITAAIAAASVSLPSGLSSLLIIYTTDAGVNLGRFFIVGGVTLVLDDLADVSERLQSGLKFLKTKAHRNGRILHLVQIGMGFVALYFLAAISIYLTQNPVEVTLANSILISSLAITVLTSFANVKRKVWFNVGSCSGVEQNALRAI